MTPIFATQEDIAAMTQAILDGKEPTTVKPKMITDIPDKFIKWSQLIKNKYRDGVPYPTTSQIILNMRKSISFIQRCSKICNFYLD